MLCRLFTIALVLAGIALLVTTPSGAQTDRVHHAGSFIADYEVVPSYPP